MLYDMLYVCAASVMYVNAAMLYNMCGHTRADVMLYDSAAVVSRTRYDVA